MGKDEKAPSLSCPHMDQAAEERLTEKIADRTVKLLESKVYLRVELLKSKIYLRVNRGVVHKALWLIGFVAVSIATWLSSKGL